MKEINNKIWLLVKSKSELPIYLPPVEQGCSEQLWFGGSSSWEIKQKSYSILTQRNI